VTPTDDTPGAGQPRDLSQPYDGRGLAAMARADRFVSDLEGVTRESSSRNVLLIRVGAVTLIVGAVAALLGLLFSQITNNPLDQSTDISLGLAGIAVSLVGATIFLRYSLAQFLRFWLLRLSYERQERQ
jgi:hypothetical protein